MKNVAFHNLGCKVNAYELDVVQQNFVKKGYKIVPFDQIADIYVINTCTVTNIADRKSRQMLHQAKKRNPEAVVIALGCYVQTGGERVLPDACVDIAIGNNRKKDTVEILEAYMEQRSLGENGQKTEEFHTDIVDISHPCEYEEMTLTKTSQHTRAYIKIQDGCNQFCSYCIIPYARGRVRSRLPQDICREIQGLAGAGYREFVLTGIHISSYGMDWEGALGGPAALEELIVQIHGIEGVDRIRLGSLEPRIVTERFVKTLAGLHKICPHFHLSLQSGCDETLKRMNRRYTTEDYRRGVELLRTYFDNPAITTDVITGFPGETREEFAQTETFLKEIRFYEMHIFPYSVRKGTVAAGMDNQVAGAIKKQRSRRLLELEKSQSLAYRRQFIGKEEEVLFEEIKEIEGQAYILGHTPRYLKVAKAAPVGTAGKLAGEIYRGLVTAMLTDEILLME